MDKNRTVILTFKTILFVAVFLKEYFRNIVFVWVKIGFELTQLFSGVYVLPDPLPIVNDFPASLST